MNVGEYHSYAKGSWYGPLDTVKANVAKYGAPEVCTFIKGYFDATLPLFSERIGFAFCDVDLRRSLETCLRYLWPLLSADGLLFTHEAHHLEIASLFYDQAIWTDSVPGLVGLKLRPGLVSYARWFIWLLHRIRDQVALGQGRVRGVRQE